MPRPYSGPKCDNLVFRELDVQAARETVPGCAGCSNQIGTKVRTPDYAGHLVTPDAVKQQGAETCLRV